MISDELMVESFKSNETLSEESSEERSESYLTKVERENKSREYNHELDFSSGNEPQDFKSLNNITKSTKFEEMREP